MSVNTTKYLSSPFLVGEWTAGMEVAVLQHAGGIAEDEVDDALRVPSRAGHAGGGVELFKLDCRDDLWISSYCSDDLWFSSAPFRCVCCGEIICARIDGLQ